MNSTPTAKAPTRKAKQSKAPPEKPSGKQSASKMPPQTKQQQTMMTPSSSGSGHSVPSGIKPPVTQPRLKALAKKTSVLRFPVLKLPVGKVAAPSSLEKKSSLVSANRAASTVKDEKKVDI